MFREDSWENSSEAQSFDVLEFRMAPSTHQLLFGFSSGLGFGLVVEVWGSDQVQLGLLFCYALRSEPIGPTSRLPRAKRNSELDKRLSSTLTHPGSDRVLRSILS